MINDPCFTTKTGRITSYWTFLKRPESFTKKHLPRDGFSGAQEEAATSSSLVSMCCGWLFDDGLMMVKYVSEI